ncbi:hypothetical protein STEPF1_00455 [Streptomyces sp. F-1]|nr:hypothetical protein STEPF1_00455 [Streptomyces sp. F-1]
MAAQAEFLVAGGDPDAHPPVRPAVLLPAHAPAALAFPALAFPVLVPSAFPVLVPSAFPVLVPSAFAASALTSSAPVRRAVAFSAAAAAPGHGRARDL